MPARCCWGRPIGRFGWSSALPAASPTAASAGADRAHGRRRWSASGCSGSRWATRTSIDHDELRHDPVMAMLAGKLEARRWDCAPVAGKSTLNRLELSRPEPTRYHKISHDRGGDRRAVRRPLCRGPRRGRRRRSSSISTPPTTRCTAIRKAASSTAITTATAICRSTSSAAGICWRPNCAVPTSTPAPAAVEEVARIVAQIRRRWPRVRILLRADAGFARERADDVVRS